MNNEFFNIQYPQDDGTNPQNDSDQDVCRRNKAIQWLTVLCLFKFIKVLYHLLSTNVKYSIVNSQHIHSSYTYYQKLILEHKSIYYIN